MELQKNLYPQERSGLRSREEKMIETPVFLGLCADCQNAADCTFPRVAGQAVRQCEEFKGLEYSGERNPMEGAFPLRSGFASDDENFEGRMGLCLNCSNQKTCSFPKPEGGVWHCEEYQ